MNELKEEKELTAQVIIEHEDGTRSTYQDMRVFSAAQGDDVVFQMVSQNGTRMQVKLKQL